VKEKTLLSNNGTVQTLMDTSLQNIKVNLEHCGFLNGTIKMLNKKFARYELNLFMPRKPKLASASVTD
jgi:hypothetical protein